MSSPTPIKRRRYITLPGGTAQPPMKLGGPLGQVVPLGIARQQLRGVKASRDMRYDLSPHFGGSA